MTFFVYELWNPHTIECFYVGKASRKRRVNDHIAEAIRVREGRGKTNNRIKTGTILKILETGCEPVRFIVGEFETEIEALQEEIRLILHYGLRKNGSGTLTNIVEGGGGTTGWRHTLEAIEVIRAASTGRGHTPEACEKIRVAATGRKHTAETLLKIAEASKNRTISESTKEKIRLTSLGRKHPPRTEEWRQKQRLARKGKPWSDVARQAREMKKNGADL